MEIIIENFGCGITHIDGECVTHSKTHLNIYTTSNKNKCTGEKLHRRRSLLSQNVCTTRAPRGNRSEWYTERKCEWEANNPQLPAQRKQLKF